MKFQEILGKGKQIVQRLGTKTIIAACAVLVLGSVIVLNYVLQKNADDTPKGSKMAIDLSADIPETTEQTASQPEADYFAAVSLQRKQARDEAMEVLLSVSESDTALEEARQAAVSDMNRMALEMEQEANIETLVQSKGFVQCVAVISGENCSVIVGSDGLMPGEVAQISEIVYEQAGIVPENLKIIEKTSTN